MEIQKNYGKSRKTFAPRFLTGRGVTSRLVSLLLVMVMALSLLPTPAAAAARSDVPSKLSLARYEAYGKYNSSWLGGGATIHFIKVKGSGGFQTTAFCGTFGGSLKSNYVYEPYMFGDSNYIEHDSGDTAPYMLFTDYYYSVKDEDPDRNAWIQACVWVMRSKYEESKGLISASVADVESGEWDSLIRKVAEEAATVTGADADTMFNNIKNGVVIPWLKKEIPHLDYAVYFTNDGSNPQDLIVPLTPEDVPGDTPAAYVKVMKVDMAGNPIPGVTFEVTDAETGEVLLQLVTGTDGTACKEVPLVSGKTTRSIVVKETAVPEGYELKSDGYPVEVDASKHNTPGKAAVVSGKAIVNGKPGKGTIKKVDQNGNGIPNALIRIYGSDSEGQRVERSVLSGEDGVVPIQWTAPDQENYISPGSYTVEEERPPFGYRSTDAVEHLDLWADGTHSGDIIFVNEKYKTIKLVKQDEEGHGLPGAVFEVRRNGALLGTVTTDENGEFVLEGTTSGGAAVGNGEGSVESEAAGLMTLGLLPGYYTFTEITPPAGYLLPAERTQGIWLFEEGDTIDQYVLTFTDYTYPDIVILKNSNGTDIPLAGAVFEISIDSQVIDTIATNANGEIVLTYAQYGEFLTSGKQSWTVSVREVSAPDGYLIDDPGPQVQELKLGEKMMVFTFTDTKYPSIRILKKDAETGEPLANTAFHILIDGVDIGTHSTNEFGYILIDYETYGRFLNERNWDSWVVTVTEVKPPEGYNLDFKTAADWTQTQTLKYGQSYAEFEFFDTSFRSIRITKRDNSNTWTLANATFTLDSITLDPPKDDTTIHREGKTDKNGQLIFDELPNGTYRLTETIPPTGYELADPNWMDIVVTSDSDNIIDVEMKDYPKQGILIRKVDAVTGRALPGATFEIEYMGSADTQGGVSGQPFTKITDDSGLIYLEDCVPGKYRIQEIKAPDGYVLVSEPYYVELVNAHEPYTLTVENYQDTQLIIMKKDAQTGLPLAGALFEIRKPSGEFVALVETGLNGIASYAGLEPGSYVVAEIMAPDGHLIDPIPQTFEVKVGQTEPVFLIFFNDGKTNLYIRKEDAQTHVGLRGAVYRVELSDGRVVKERLETGEDGIAYLSDLEPGTYIVTETEPPEGYLLNPTPQRVYLDKGRTESLLFRNEKPGGIAILKTDAISGLPLANAEFTFYTIDNKPIGTYKTGVDGYIRVSDLEPGYYFVQESKAPEGYLLDNTRHQVLVENFKVTRLELVNYEQSTLTIYKVAKESNIPLAGAVFGVYDMHGSLIQSITTNASGIASINGLQPGWYRVKETRAPSGYVLNEEEQQVEIVDGKPATLTFENVEASGITVHKIDAVNREPLSGAEFELRTIEGKLLGIYTTDASGSFVTEKVEPGSYYLYETKAPDGYYASGEPTLVTVLEDEYPVVTIENRQGTSIEIMKTDAVTGAYLEGAEFEVWTLDMTKLLGVYATDKTGIVFTDPLPPGNYIVKESRAPLGYALDETHHHVQVLFDHPALLKVPNQPLTAIMITKVSTVDDEPLLGAKFEVRTAEGDLIGEYTTDTTGTAVTPVLEPGVYYVREVEPPDGYLLNPTVFRVELKAGVMYPLVVEDAPEATLVIFKGDSSNKRGIAGAVFKVEAVDYAFIGTYTTDAQGEALVRPIPPGHYIVTEMSAPEGYLVSDTPKTVTVLPGIINRVEFMDAAKGSLVIRLEDQADGHKLENGRFQLFLAETGKMIAEGVTDNSGSIVWGSLDPGRYMIVQTYPPDGYTIVDERKEGIVISGDTTEVVFKDYTAGLVIEKLDKLTSEPLAGARFQVTRNSDNIVIGEYETDVDGLALVSGLIEGMYTIEELVAPTGYALDEEPRLVHVKANEQAHETFLDTPLAGITINTVDKDTRAPLSGVTIEVKHQNGVVVNTYTSDSTGAIMTEKLAAGYYVLTVIKAENNYKAVLTEQTVEVKNGVPATITFEFTASGALQIRALAADETGLPGMKVTVTKINGEAVGSYTTDASGLIQVPGLEPGWYVVKEVSSPDSYTVSSNSEQNVEVTSNGSANVEFRHQKAYGLQIRTVVKQTGAMLAGVKYQILKLDGTVIGSYTSDASGLVYVSLEPGWYVVKQTELPAGYAGQYALSERNVEVVAGAPVVVEFELAQLSSIRVKFIDGSTELPIYGVRVLLKNGAGEIVDEYTSNNEGYITLRESIAAGTYTLEQISVPAGYSVDSVPKTIEVGNGGTTEVVWRMYTGAGQIQVHLTSNAYNPTLDLAAGSNLQGAVFEVYDPFTYVVLATMTTDSYGVAASNGLPIGRYIVREKTPAPYYGLSGKETEVYIKITNDVVRIEYEVGPMELKTSHSIKANAKVEAGTSMKVIFEKVNNESSDRLDNFYWNIKVPSDCMRGGTLYTGKWSHSIVFSISYKTNMNDYRQLASNLNSSQAYQYDLSSLSVNVQAGEYVTDIRFEFGTIPANFKPTVSPILYGYVMPTIPNGYKCIIRSECGGKYGEAWNTASALWTTTVVNNNKTYSNAGLPYTLPKTGY